MSHFIVDGKERSWPVTGDVTVADLLTYLRTNYNSDRVLVANVKINGQEISARDEATLAPIPVSTLESVEIFTAHPRELAEETLQMLLPFVEHMAKLALTAVSSEGTAGEASFRKLVDALSTFSSAVDSARGVMRTGSAEEPHAPLIGDLEAGTIATLRQILKAREEGRITDFDTLLTQDLIANFSAWHDEGIPALIRSRDC
jgi:hypothetical protein